MKHVNSTKLLKGSLTRTAVHAVILVLVLAGCRSNRGHDNTFPLIGKWKITGLETGESRGLDSLSRKIYQQEVNKMLDSSFMLLSTDSAYHLRIGTEEEKGRWKWDGTDSLLQLQDTLHRKSYFTVQVNGDQSFILKKELDPRELVMVIETYHIK